MENYKLGQYPPTKEQMDRIRFGDKKQYNSIKQKSAFNQMLETIAVSGAVVGIGVGLPILAVLTGHYIGKGLSSLLYPKKDHYASSRSYNPNKLERSVDLIETREEFIRLTSRSTILQQWEYQNSQKED